MKMNLLLSLFFVSTAAAADCTMAYKSMIKQLNNESEALIPTSAIFGIGFGTIASLMPIPGSAVAGGISSAGAVGVTAYMSAKAEDLNKGNAVVTQSQLSDGLDLRQLHSDLKKETGASYEEVVTAIKTLNSSKALCSPQPLAYSEIVDLLTLALKK